MAVVEQGVQPRVQEKPVVALLLVARSGADLLAAEELACETPLAVHRIGHEEPVVSPRGHELPLHEDGVSVVEQRREGLHVVARLVRVQRVAQVLVQTAFHAVLPDKVGEQPMRVANLLIPVAEQRQADPVAQQVRVVPRAVAELPFGA